MRVEIFCRMEIENLAPSATSAISSDHNYSLPSSKVLAERYQKLCHDHRVLIRKMKISNQMIKRKRKKILKMKDVLAKLKSSGLISHEDAGQIQTMLTPTLNQIIERLRMSNLKGTNTYPEVDILFLLYNPAIQILVFFQELRAFAITLQFYSTKAYEFVRKTFLKCLPRVSTIRKWFSNVDGRPGFSEMALKLLRKKVEDESKRGI